MFNSLTGELTGHAFPLVYLRTGGVEWQLEVSATTFQEILADERKELLHLYVYLQVREDLLKLYGFSRNAERSAFLELITVTGIGPRQALRILSGTTAAQLTRLLEAEDVAALTRLPGLGTKTAQKMILQLKGHLVLDQGDSASPSVRPDEPVNELLQALVEMGYDRSAAQHALQRLSEQLDQEGVVDRQIREQRLFSTAIRELSL